MFFSKIKKISVVRDVLFKTNLYVYCINNVKYIGNLESSYLTGILAPLFNKKGKIEVCKGEEDD